MNSLNSGGAPPGGGGPPFDPTGIDKINFLSGIFLPKRPGETSPLDCTWPDTNKRVETHEYKGEFNEPWALGATGMLR
jgi:hypothetical protein